MNCVPILTKSPAGFCGGNQCWVGPLVSGWVVWSGLVALLVGGRLGEIHLCSLVRAHPIFKNNLTIEIFLEQFYAAGC